MPQMMDAHPSRENEHLSGQTPLEHFSFFTAGFHGVDMETILRPAVVEPISLRWRGFPPGAVVHPRGQAPAIRCDLWFLTLTVFLV